MHRSRSRSRPASSRRGARTPRRASPGSWTRRARFAAECGKPHAYGSLAAATGIGALMQGRFAEGLIALEDAERILCTCACTGVTWERDTIAIQMSWTQIYPGRFAALAALVPDAIREAEKRDDRYLATALRTGPFVYRERVPYITALGDLLSAGIVAARGDLPISAALLRRARSAFDATGLALHAAVARLRLADLVGGSEGDTLRVSALSYAAREQVTAVSAVTDHLAPGFTNV